MTDIYDAIVIGAGPAGLSAATYLARFKRKTLIIDSEKGRSTLPGVYRNLLGFGRPVGRREYRKLGLEHALKYGANKVFGEVKDIKVKDNETFELVCEDASYFSKYIIFCTGVTDNWPEIKDAEKYIGLFIYCCPICDGFESTNKTLIGVGHDDRLTKTALCLLNYTDKIILTTNGKPLNIEEKNLNKIKRAGIPIFTNKITNFTANGAKLEKVFFDDGREIEANYIFSVLGVNVNSQLAQKIGVEVNNSGYIIVDSNQKTSVDKIYAAGDVTNFNGKQIVTTLYEGYRAGLAIYSEMLKEKLTDI